VPSARTSGSGAPAAGDRQAADDYDRPGSTTIVVTLVKSPKKVSVPGDHELVRPRRQRAQESDEAGGDGERLLS